MTRKIAFIGTHGTGKTTLAHDLVAALKKARIDADFLGEIARKCPFPINENTTKKSQIWIILQQIIQELECEDKSEILVCDRSVFDGYCYYVNKFGRNRALEPLVLKHIKTYDYIVKVPIRRGFLKKDKVRSTTKTFQRRIDILINKLLKKLKIKCLTLKEFQKIKIKDIVKTPKSKKVIIKHLKL